MRLLNVHKSCVHTVCVFPIGLLSSLSCKHAVARGNTGCSWKCWYFNHSDRALTSDLWLEACRVTSKPDSSKQTNSHAFSAPLLLNLLSQITATLCPLITGYCTPSLTFDYSWTRVLFLLDHSNSSKPELRQEPQCYPLQAHPGLASSVMNWKSSSGMNSKNKAFYWAPYPFPWLLRLHWSCDYLEAHERHWNYFRAQLKIISETVQGFQQKEAVC